LALWLLGFRGVFSRDADQALKEAHEIGQAVALMYWGKPQDGSRAVTEALGRADQTGARWIEAELHRVRGERVLLHSAEPPEAAACLRRASAVAREQGAKFWQLGAATSLARLWCDQGEYGEARGLLAPAHSCFTEDFDTPVCGTPALLEQLA
jgi:hypothetical protein